MRDYEELVNSLKNCLYIPCNEAKKEKCLAGKERDCRRELMAIATNAIEELCRENESLAKSVNEAAEILRNRKPKWISVEDRLPEKYHQVLVYGQNGLQIDYYAGAKSICGNPLFMISEAKATHWMPLPEPPKEE
jgi:hypothetical protein